MKKLEIFNISMAVVLFVLTLVIAIFDISPTLTTIFLSIILFGFCAFLIIYQLSTFKKLGKNIKHTKFWKYFSIISIITAIIFCFIIIILGSKTPYWFSTFTIIFVFSVIIFNALIESKLFFANQNKYLQIINIISSIILEIALIISYTIDNLVINIIFVCALILFTIVAIINIVLIILKTHKEEYNKKTN